MGISLKFYQIYNAVYSAICTKMQIGDSTEYLEIPKYLAQNAVISNCPFIFGCNRSAKIACAFLSGWKIPNPQIILIILSCNDLTGVAPTKPVLIFIH